MSFQVRSTFIPNSYQEQILDSYEVISSIFNEMGGQNNLSVEMDRSLPVITGNPIDILFNFQSLINSLIKKMPSIRQEIYISQKKDPLNWVFTFKIKEFVEQDSQGDGNELKAKLIRRSLLIPKKGQYRYPIYLL